MCVCYWIGLGSLFGVAAAGFMGCISVHAKLLSLRWSEAMEAESAEEEEEESA
jgi:hypothetical protein